MNKQLVIHKLNERLTEIGHNHKDSNHIFLTLQRLLHGKKLNKAMQATVKKVTQ